MKKTYKLEHTDIFPTVDGLHISQTMIALENFKKIIPSFDVIIEIGYYRGGLTQWFAINKKPNAKIIAYDITDTHRNSQEFDFDPEIEFIASDCFSEIGVKNIKELLKSEGSVLLFCDGGNKIKEFNFFSEYLKPKDVIMVHDYYDDTLDEPYALNLNWPSPYETTYSSIQQSIKKNKLKKYKYQDFRKSLIGSFIK